MKEFYKALLDTAESAGIKILSDDYCCRLLAFLYEYGGGLEAVVHNYKLNQDIRHAQKRLNLFGGCIPDKKLFPLLKHYCKEIENGRAKPAWLLEIAANYNITLETK